MRDDGPATCNPEPTSLGYQRVAGGSGDDRVEAVPCVQEIGDALVDVRALRRPIVAAGHSFGGQTAGVLVGLRVMDPKTGIAQDISDPRVMASMQLATAGKGGVELTPFALDNAPWLRDQDFSHITAPGLVIAGDADELPLSTRGPSWTTDPYTLSRSDKSLLTVYGGQHSLGGIAGYEAAETTDEDPGRVALIQQVTLAYLRHVTGTDHTDWETAQAALAGDSHPLGRLESK
ncbi:chlorophyllase [Streptomyces noursei]|uniref:chlorophyllase n=1 Tax=Streptomyces noursei TaxID=1971 RepID=UPI003EBD409C